MKTSGEGPLLIIINWFLPFNWSDSKLSAGLESELGKTKPEGKTGQSVKYFSVWKMSMLTLCLVIAFCAFFSHGQDFEVPDATVEAFTPRGLRVSIPGGKTT